MKQFRKKKKPQHPFMPSNWPQGWKFPGPPYPPGWDKEKMDKEVDLRKMAEIIHKCAQIVELKDDMSLILKSEHGAFHYEFKGVYK